MAVFNRTKGIAPVSSGQGCCGDELQVGRYKKCEVLYMARQSVLMQREKRMKNITGK